MFGKKKNASRATPPSDQNIVGFTKSKKFLLWKIKSKPIYSQTASTTLQHQPAAQPHPPFPTAESRSAAPIPPAQKPSAPIVPSTSAVPKPSAAPSPAPVPSPGVQRKPYVPPALPPTIAQAQQPPPPQPSTPQAQKGAAPAVPAATQPTRQIPKALRQPPKRPIRERGLGDEIKKPSQFAIYIDKIILRKRGLEAAIRDTGIKKSPYDFVKGMIINAIIVAAAIGVAAFALFMKLLQNPVVSVLLGGALGFAIYNMLLNNFVDFPLKKIRQMGKEIERDILFAARDVVISMRSGMPLFNAMTAVSTGYGAASKEFKKIVDMVQLGVPISQAMEEVSEKSQSKTFKRILLQASVSIRAGADITGSLQAVVDEVTQERVIDLRRYGQRLNALAMFYMLFGVIFPSMGIAVAVILTLFIHLITITPPMLDAALVAVAFLQIVFLNIMRTSRPTFAL